MRKLVLVFAGVLALAGAAVALAVTNTYRVTASTFPTSAGTTKKPVNVKLSFNYKVGEIDNQRPSPVKQYKIAFAGIRVNTAPFKACTAERIGAENSDAGCPSGSRVGSGNVQAYVGPHQNADGSPNNEKPLFCYLKLTVYNAGNNHAALFLQGSQTATDPAKRCAADITAAIDAAFIRSSKGTTLQFTVPEALRHPIAGFDSAVFNTTSVINKVTKKVHGKTVGFFQSVGGCKSSKRNVTVTFVSESGQSSRAQTFAKCKK